MYRHSGHYIQQSRKATVGCDNQGCCVQGCKNHNCYTNEGCTHIRDKNNQGYHFTGTPPLTVGTNIRQGSFHACTREASALNPGKLFRIHNIVFKTRLRIRIHFIRIRIQHFRLNTDPDPGL